MGNVGRKCLDFKDPWFHCDTVQAVEVMLKVPGWKKCSMLGQCLEVFNAMLGKRKCFDATCPTCPEGWADATGTAAVGPHRGRPGFGCGNGAVIMLDMSANMGIKNVVKM